MVAWTHGPLTHLGEVHVRVGDPVPQLDGGVAPRPAVLVHLDHRPDTQGRTGGGREGGRPSIRRGAVACCCCCPAALLLLTRRPASPRARRTSSRSDYPHPITVTQQREQQASSSASTCSTGSSSAGGAGYLFDVVVVSVHAHDPAVLAHKGAEVLLGVGVALHQSHDEVQLVVRLVHQPVLLLLALARQLATLLLEQRLPQRIRIQPELRQTDRQPPQQRPTNSG